MATQRNSSNAPATAPTAAPTAPTAPATPARTSYDSIVPQGRSTANEPRDCNAWIPSFGCARCKEAEVKAHPGTKVGMVYLGDGMSVIRMTCGACGTTRRYPLTGVPVYFVEGAAPAGIIARDSVPLHRMQAAIRDARTAGAAQAGTAPALPAAPADRS